MSPDDEATRKPGDAEERGPPPAPILEGPRSRRFEERRSTREGPRDVDAAGRARSLQAGGWAAVASVMGVFAGGMATGTVGGAILGAVLVGGAVYGVAIVIVGRTGAAASKLYMPTGRSTPRDREYSLAESLVARGRYEDAISAFEVAREEHPEDPVPYVRIARLYRDHLERPDAAVRWFKRARAEVDLGEGQAHLVVRELVELYRKVGTPAKAAPELARMAERHAGTPRGEWARAELAEVKKLIADQRP